MWFMEITDFDLLRENCIDFLLCDFYFLNRNLYGFHIFMIKYSIPVSYWLFKINLIALL